MKFGFEIPSLETLNEYRFMKVIELIRSVAGWVITAVIVHDILQAAVAIFAVL